MTIVARLGGIVGTGAVISGGDMAPHLTDWRGRYTGRARCVVKPASTEEVAASRGTYNPQWHYDNEPEARAALDLIGANHFSQTERVVFAPFLDVLLGKVVFFLHRADRKSYIDAHVRLGELYLDQEKWSRTAVLNIAASRIFSSDRTIAEYARDIWHVEPCAVK